MVETIRIPEHDRTLRLIVDEHYIRLWWDKGAGSKPRVAYWSSLWAGSFSKLRPNLKRSTDVA